MATRYSRVSCLDCFLAACALETCLVAPVAADDTIEVDLEILELRCGVDAAPQEICDEWEASLKNNESPEAFAQNYLQGSVTSSRTSIRLEPGMRIERKYELQTNSMKIAFDVAEPEDGRALFNLAFTVVNGDTEKKAGITQAVISLGEEPSLVSAGVTRYQNETGGAPDRIVRAVLIGADTEVGEK